MSNEGEERNQEAEQHKRTSPEYYCRALAKVAVSQICEGVGLEGVKKSALEAFSDLAVTYISNLGKSAKHYSALAGRADCNIFDVVKGLEDLSSTRGFLGASEVNCCAIDSGALQEVIDYVATAEEIQFAQPIPLFPVSKTSSGAQSFSQLAQTPSENHIPEWLPVFPTPHTDQNNPVVNELHEEPNFDTAEESSQRLKAENALLRLQQRLVSNESAGPSGSENPTDGVHEKGASDYNPFLAPPLPAGEKEVSQIAVPPSLVSTQGNKKHGNLSDTFAVAIDAAKVREQDSMDIDNQLSTERRHPVCFKLKTGKKMLSENMDVELRNKGDEEGRVPAVNIDEKRTEKKRRAEKIVMQSMMNP